ncbi:MAG: hypothetical protein K1X72_01980 [Pyrinomonadaceae bacterium]|nr:hypothetical protein [Pyrinomonadaceae bacterium]
MQRVLRPFGRMPPRWTAFRQVKFLEMKFSKYLSFFILITAILFAQAAVFSQTKSGAEFTKFKISKEDDAFLEDLSKRSFMFFWENADPKTGLMLDRAKTDGSGMPKGHPSYNIASSAATGFALTSYCIAADRKWITTEEAKTRTRNTLDYYANRSFHKNGWFYHWLDRETGERRWNSEISSIDTALLLGGILSVRQCFANDKEIVDLATQIYNRIDFQWMLDGDKYLLSHGWKPETGFLKHRWHDYSESSSLYLLAIGSPTKPISPQSWYKWERQRVDYAGYKYISAKAPIFVHQYSQGWFDFRNKRERNKGFSTDYHQNSVIATRAHKACNLSLKDKFPGYSENVWGITAMDSSKGYVVWDCPPAAPEIDGTVAPYTAAASMMFTPDIALSALKEMKAKYGDKIYGRYGFADAFNPNTGWVDSEVLGIDVGIQLIGIENFRSGNVWKWFMANAEAKNALKLAKIK